MSVTGGIEHKIYEKVMGIQIRTNLGGFKKKVNAQ